MEFYVGILARRVLITESKYNKEAHLQEKEKKAIEICQV